MVRLKRSKQLVVVLVVGVGILGFILRSFNLDWDQSYHLHPDERFLTMVAGAIEWPDSWADYLNTDKSTLNPHNVGYAFYVYGTLPVIVTKGLATVINQDTYDGLALTGRWLSALAGSITVVLLYFTTVIITNNKKMALLAGLLMATNVMGIQLGHFFAMDTFLVMFMVASFWSMLRLLKLELKTSWSTKLIQATLTAIFFGLALSAKISAILFAPILALMYLQGTLRKIHWKEWLIGGGWILMISLLTLRLGQPYLFAGTGDDFWRLNQKVIDNWKMLKTYDDPTPLFPPATQWINTTPYVFPLINFSLFSMGIAWALIGFISLSRIGVLIKQKQWGLVWSAIWVIGLFIYQGGQFAKAMRYLYPLIPFLVILMAETVMVSKKGWGWFMKILLLTGLLWPLMFVKIYTRPPSRLAASEWMYQSIPRGSKITCDYWDDCLPLPIGKKTHTWFKILELHPYDLPDDTAKIRRLAEVLEQTDFWVMSSNRLFAAITSVPEKHPLTSNMYQLLFDGKLGFTKVAEFTSRPGINFLIKPWCLTPPLADYGLVAKASQECNEPGLTVVDDYAEESFTVYDHPKVLIFQKTASLKTNDYVKMVAGGQ